MRQLKLTFGKIVIHAELFDTPTADALWDAAPFEARVAHWGEEVYFTVPIKADREPDARDVVLAGELAFRHEGEAVVIGYGPTPMSHGSEIRLAVPANVWGRTPDDVHVLAKLEEGELIKVEPFSPED